MGLETGSKVSDLNEANPLGTDAKSQGDDHIRLIKSVLKLDVFAASLANSSTDKAIPADADLFLIADSDASFIRKKLSWANFKSIFAALYAKIGAVTGTGITMSTERLLGRSTAATGAVEEITVSTGLSLSAGELSCTVTSPISSVGGYTGAVTAANLLAAISAVDGSGSGLDADLLDGYHAASFAAVSHTHSGYVPTDMYAGAIGMVAFCQKIGVGSLANNGTIAGSSLQIGVFCSYYGNNAWLIDTSVSGYGAGTWRNVSGLTMSGGGLHLCQRIS